MLPNNVHLLTALDRQYRGRRVKEAEHARKLRSLMKNQAETSQEPPKKPPRGLKWLQQART